MPESVASRAANVAEFTVSELAGAIRRALEQGFGHVRLRGEISGYRGPHASGHCYFGLKDDKAKIDAVVWRGVFQRLAVKPEEGLEVVVQGRVSAFPGSSKYQIVIESLEPAGAGALMALLEARKKKLGAEGLFDDARKKKPPFLPSAVGIVTSPTGAVIRDMLHGFAERFPTRVLVWPVRVQGETSAAEVAAAIRGFNALPPSGPIPRPGVLIVARGGGSLEDLWGFNEEIVVRAAAESAIPLISAVGHETDWTLIDLAADARAPTPTKAAEWAVPKYSELSDQVTGLGLRLGGAARNAAAAARANWRGAARGLPRREDLLASPRQRFDFTGRRLSQCFRAYVEKRASRLAQAAGRLPAPCSLARLPRQRFDAAASRLSRALLSNTAARGLRFARLSSRLRPEGLAGRAARARERLRAVEARGRLAWTNSLAARRRHLAAQEKLLASLGYRNVLARGYAVVRGADGAMKRRAGDIAPGVRLDIEFADGHVLAEALGTANPPDDMEKVHDRNPPRDVRRSPKKARGPGQGSLF